jgi:hypothetical protein
LIETAAFHHVVGALGPLAEAGHRLEQAAQRISEGELAGELVRDVEARAARLGTLAVRSSAALEDRATGAAAGVFSSVVAVPPSEVWPAIRAVWTSGARSRRRTASRTRRHRGHRAALASPASAPPPAALPERRADAQGLGATRGLLDKLARSTDDPIVAWRLRAERAIEARARVRTSEPSSIAKAVWLVQARPIASGPHARRPPPPAVLAPLVEDRLMWTWDVAHNPDPLSPAQSWSSA